MLESLFVHGCITALSWSSSSAAACVLLNFDPCSFISSPLNHSSTPISLPQSPLFPHATNTHPHGDAITPIQPPLAPPPAPASDSSPPLRDKTPFPHLHTSTDKPIASTSSSPPPRPPPNSTYCSHHNADRRTGPVDIDTHGYSDSAPEPHHPRSRHRSLGSWPPAPSGWSASTTRWRRWGRGLGSGRLHAPLRRVWVCRAWCLAPGWRGSWCRLCSGWW